MKYILFFIILIFLGCSNKPIDGKTLYTKKCANCHGQMARKSALGKSAPIGGFTKEQTIHALKGYQEGTYGGGMKNTMKQQVSSLNDEEITAIAKYIDELY